MTDPRLKIILTSWAPFIGGAEVAVERLAVGLGDAGHDVTLVVGTEGEALERFQQAGIRCRFIPQRFTDKLGWLKYRKSRNELQRLIETEQPDLVHANDLPSGQMTADAARRVGVPCVCHHRWVFEGEAIDWLNKFEADRHLFVSRALMNQLCEESARLAASDRAVVYDGLPLPDVPAEDERIAAKRELSVAGWAEPTTTGGQAAVGKAHPTQLLPGKQLILFAGQIIERKGVADLLHAWNEIAPRWQDQTELRIVGDDLAGEGEYRARMEQLAGQLGCPVHFMGFQKNVDRWLTAADIVTVPSHVEPLGNATLEAMSYARPVIGGDAGGIPEMVVHEQTGLLVSPRSPHALAVALETLLSNESMRKEYGTAARLRCEEMFSLDAHVQSVLAEYEQVLSSHRVEVAT